MYQNFQRVIENANVIISTYECDDMGESQQVDPCNGTVAFGSALFGWAFTLTRFATTYSDKFKLDRSKLMQKFWGENFFNPAKKQFQTADRDDENKVLPRCFVQFIMRPIIQLIRHIMSDNIEAVWKMLETLQITMKHEEKEKRMKDLFKCIFQKWINAAEALLEMIIMKLPSPKRAQSYRAAYLYEGPIDDPCGQSIKNCDKNGALMIFISKMVPTNDKGRFYAFGRVFGGTA